MNADSPAPFPSFQLQTTNVFPRLPRTNRKIESMKDLTDFVGEHRLNVKGLEPGSPGSETQLSIWALSRPKPHGPVQVPGPLTIRIAIRDVAIIFLKMSWKIEGENKQLAIESLVALGPREKVRLFPPRSRRNDVDVRYLTNLTEKSAFPFGLYCVSEVDTASYENDRARTRRIAPTDHCTYFPSRMFHSLVLM